MGILILEDKLGISQGYRDHWISLVLGAGLRPEAVTHRSIWRTQVASMFALLIRKGNRKSPGFNPDPAVQSVVHSWVKGVVEVEKPELILCMDVALLGIVEPAWDIATIDNLRGGVYDYSGTPWLVMTPISAIHTQKRPKDIKVMNDGAESKDEWEEEERDPEELFIEPYTIPFGKRILAADLRKAYRIMLRMNQ